MIAAMGLAAVHVTFTVHGIYALMRRAADLKALCGQACRSRKFFAQKPVG
jgi:hypothetical protein